jgi:hypothetical protein
MDEQEKISETPVMSGDVRDGNGRFVKGVSGNPSGPGNGYKKKLNKIIESYADAFEGLGGVESLLEWARSNKSVFYKIILTLLPKDFRLSDQEGNPLIPPTIIFEAKKNENG